MPPSPYLGLVGPKAPGVAVQKQSLCIGVKVWLLAPCICGAPDDSAHAAKGCRTSRVVVPDGVERSELHCRTDGSFEPINIATFETDKPE